jgi:hypothetical protein
MTEPGKTVTTEFVFRRLGDAFPLTAPDTLPALLWGVCGGLLLMAAVSVLIPLTRFGRASSRGGFLGALAGAVFGVLFGKIDDGRPGLWHRLAVGGRAALFVTPVLFVGVARNFEVDTEVLWYAFTGVVLLLAWALTALMYARDARAAGWWAAPLALLRMATLAVLAVCFLLPAYQTWEDTEKRSKVVVILDVSPSVTGWSDEVSRAEGAKLKTRMDKILDFLTDDQVAFVANLVKKNPVSVYRFGARLDDEAGAVTADGGNWLRQDWEAFVRYDFKPAAVRGLSADGQAKLKSAVAWRGDEPGTGDWPFAWIKASDADAGVDALTDADKEAVRENRAKMEKRIDLAKAIGQGTAMPDSVTAAVNREAANMTQGVIVFSDGRSNIGSDSAFAELGKRAKEANIPIFTVGVGEAREVVALTVSDLQAPDSAQPDEPTQVTVTADGVGFKENEEVEVILELFLPGRDVKTDPADHELRQNLKFAAGDPPHGETTFVLDAEEFAKKGAMTLVEEAPPSKIGRKYQLKQGKDKGAWQVRAKIARDKREVFRDEFHLSPVRAVQVIDKPVRVLLVTSGASREYQTLRTLLVRETEQKRAEVSIYFQNEGGQEGTIVQDVEPGRLLTKFPDELDTAKKTTAPAGDAADAVALMRTRYNNLDEYDVIVVFDPDWNEKDKGGAARIPDGAMKKVKSWVENLGGGLVYVAGTFYTPQLARTDDENGRLTPIRDILPVVPDDVVLLTSKGYPRTYRRLKLFPTPDAELLRLDEEIPLPEAEKATAGWERFFTGRDRFTPSAVPGEDWAPKRGFLSAYPVKLVKPGNKPLAEFVDVDEKGQPRPIPYYVTTQVGAGRTAWIGSPEIYRVRQTDINYYDRFWLKLLRFAAAKRNAKTSRGQVLMGKEFVSGSPIRVQARVLQPNGEAYPEGEVDKPKFTIKQFDQNGNLVKEHGPFDVLKPTKLGAKFDGYYKGAITADPRQFPVDGYRYRIGVTKGDLPEPLESEFLLRTSNPELDNTKPDFAALATAATGVKEVTDRIADADLRNKVAAAFARADADPAKARLAFKLNETDKLSLIPDCLRTESRVQRNRGAVDDLWDDEVVPPNAVTDALRGELFGPFRLWVPAAVVAAALVAVAWVVRSRVGNPALGTLMTLALLLAICLTAAVVYCGNPFPVGIAVAAICGLLGLEWLTRKLLRLA